VTEPEISGDRPVAFDTELENLCGVGLESILAHAAKKAWYVLDYLDPERRQDFTDVAQEVVMKLLSGNLPAEVGRWDHWISSAVWNQVRMDIRARNAAKRPPDKRRVDVDDLGELPLAATRDLMEEAIEASIAKRVFDDLVDDLEPEDKRLVFLATFVFNDAVAVGYIEERTAEQVAEVTGFHPSKVKRLWRHGKPELREALRKYLDDRENPKDL
jgi:RNA polymerase sigma factor (sigma-70 family)